MDDFDKSADSPSPPLSNAFSLEYLDRLRRREAAAPTEGESAGPWELRQHEGAYPLLRAWEGFEHGDSPEAGGF